MCMHCGCRRHQLIARYMREHDEVYGGLRALQQAGETHDAARVAALIAEIAPALIEHNENEEIALFPAVRSTGKYGGLVQELMDDHVYFVEASAAIEAGDLAEVTPFVRRLKDHIFSENNGIFPGAEFVLSAEQWEAVHAATP